jgi:hypothetical protein
MAAAAFLVLAPAAAPPAHAEGATEHNQPYYAPRYQHRHDGWRRDGRDYDHRRAYRDRRYDDDRRHRYRDRDRRRDDDPGEIFRRLFD